MFSVTQKAHSKRETFGLGHRSVGGHMMFNALEDSSGTRNSKWLIPCCGWPSKLLLFLSSLWSKDFCICFSNQERKPNGFMVFKLSSLILFFHCLYTILCLKRKQMKQCEYGFKGAWELPTLKYDWLEKNIWDSLDFFLYSKLIFLYISCYQLCFYYYNRRYWEQTKAIMK